MMSELEREMNKTPKITAEFRYGKASVYRPNMPNNWKVTLRFKRRVLTTDFYGGEMVENPTAADVLSSLFSDASAGDESFEDFCGAFGYDTDSLRAYRTWQDCAEMTSKLARFLGDDIKRFAGLEH